MPYPDEVKPGDYTLKGLDDQYPHFCIGIATSTDGKPLMWFTCSCAEIGVAIDTREWYQPRARIFQMWEAHKILAHTKPDKLIENTKPL